MEIDYGFPINSQEKHWLKLAIAFVLVFLITFFVPVSGDVAFVIYAFLFVVGLVTVTMSMKTVREDEYFVFEFKGKYYVLKEGSHFVFPFLSSRAVKRSGTLRPIRVKIFDGTTQKFLADYAARVNVILEYRIIDPAEYVKEFYADGVEVSHLQTLFGQKISSFLINISLDDFKKNLNNINLSVVLAQSFDAKKDAYRDSELWKGLKNAGIEVTGLIMDITDFRNIDPFSDVSADNLRGVHRVENLKRKIQDLENLRKSKEDSVKEPREKMKKDVENKIINEKERLNEEVTQTKAAQERFNQKEVERLKKEHGENDPKVWSWLAAQRIRDEREIQRILDDN